MLWSRCIKSDSPRKSVRFVITNIFGEIGHEEGLTSEYIFTYVIGFKGALRHVEIEDFRFRGQRDTFASHLVMRGAKFKEVQELLGHKRIIMTMRYAFLPRNIGKTLPIS